MLGIHAALAVLTAEFATIGKTWLVPRWGTLAPLTRDENVRFYLERCPGKYKASGSRSGCFPLCAAGFSRLTLVRHDSGVAVVAWQAATIDKSVQDLETS